ncbi:MAG: hypothetical protein ACLUEK_05225 [Oscillospiraceae bacterium]
MPTVPDEKNAGIADGVVINTAGPKRIIGKNGKVTGVEFMRCTSVRDASGKFAPKYDENDTVTAPTRGHRPGPTTAASSRGHQG